jgi:hypothetical protein
MAQAFVLPRWSEESTHDPRSEHNMPFALGAIHIAASDVPNVMQREGCP